MIDNNLQGGGHGQHGGAQQQVGDGQVDDEVVGGDPQVSVADHGQDDEDVPDDGEHDEGCQHHADRHRPAQVQRGGSGGPDGAVGGVGVRRRGLCPGEQIHGGAVSPQTHG